MKSNISAITLLILIHFNGSISISKESIDWAVRIEGGENIAKKISDETDFIYLGPVGNLENIYHFQKRKLPRYKRSIDLHTNTLRSHEKVLWAEPQKTLIREKRNNKMYHEKRMIAKMFNDPKWSEEWYLFDNRFINDTQYDMKVVPVWLMNITGRNVKSTIIDDGIEYTHPDLKDNYDPLCSTDLNDEDDDPMPKTGPGTSNEHGTRCASEIAMAANNNICGVGIAFNSKIGGIRILDGKVNDLIEAKSLGFNNQYIDIYSASWGPKDDGKTIEGPGILASEALRRGAEYGRKGKGNLFVWASGNGGYYKDSCSCDGYTSSIYVISVSSVLPYNDLPAFTEPCPSTICSTYSSTQYEKSKLIVADLGKKCSDDHTGTSASAPYAAGIFALALEVNPDLTWRDIKHLITWTSNYESLSSTKGWKKNSAGFWVNSYFGFGLLNAFEMVKYAKSWKTVPKLINCSIVAKVGGEISISKSQQININGNPCSKEIAFIENIIVNISLSYNVRGALLITLRSPHGMNTTLLPLRPLDNSRDGLKNWPLNTVQNWGEKPEGIWTVFIEDKSENTNKERKGFLENLIITFHGTAELPFHVENDSDNEREY